MLKIPRLIKWSLRQKPRRSQRIRHRPNYYAEGVSGELKTYEDVATSFNNTKWEQAMVADMLTKGLPCGTFELLREMAGIVPIPVSFRASEKEC